MDARLGQFRVDAEQRIMRLDVFVLEIAGQRDPRRNHRDGSEDRPILQDQTDLAVILHHLPQLGLELAAIRALIVEPFDDRDVAFQISGDGRIGIAQHKGFGQHLFIVAFREGRTRHRSASGEERTGAEQPECAAAVQAG